MRREERAAAFDAYDEGRAQSERDMAELQDAARRWREAVRLAREHGAALVIIEDVGPVTIALSVPPGSHISGYTTRRRPT